MNLGLGPVGARPVGSGPLGSVPDRFKPYFVTSSEVLYGMKKNVGSQNISAQMITIADGSPFTGAVTVTVTKDNGTQLAGGGVVAHKGGGEHNYALTQAESNANFISFKFAGTDAITTTREVYTTFPQTEDLAAKIGVNGAALTTLASQVSVDNLPTTPEFEARTMVSASYFVAGSYTAPDNAGIAANQVDLDAIIASIAALDTVVDAVGVLATNNGTAITANGIAISTNSTNITANGVAISNNGSAIAANGIVVTANGVAIGNLKDFDPVTQEVSANVAKINGTPVIGAGNTGNKWRA